MPSSNHCLSLPALKLRVDLHIEHVPSLIGPASPLSSPLKEKSSPNQFQISSIFFPETVSPGQILGLLPTFY